MPETLLTVDALTRAIFDARRRHVADTTVDPNAYAKLWREDDVLPTGPARALTTVLRTRGCTWDYQHSCTMCGYFVDVLPKKLTPENLIEQWRRVEAQRRDETILKIYTGGNFLDGAEVFVEAQRAIVQGAGSKFKLIVVETRPEYVKPETVQPLVDLAAPGGAQIMLALGVESTNDLVCDQAINKGYGFREFVSAARIAHDAGALVKAYLLLKPPFLTEDETVEDMVTSVRDCAPHADVISVNPTNVQKHTLVDEMFRRGEYRPPWLWSILEVLRRSRSHFPKGILKSDPVGGGRARGAHNCGTCDPKILPLLERYNATQDVAFVEAAEAVACSCRTEYGAIRDLEGHLQGSFFTR